MITERDVEARLSRIVSKAGGLCLKWTGSPGFPDRLCFLPGGELVVVECKAPGKEPRPLQIHAIDKLKALGFRVRVVDFLIDGLEDLK